MATLAIPPIASATTGNVTVFSQPVGSSVNMTLGPYCPSVTLA